MKFISLFTKTPSYQVFSYVPRYYNPQKEENIAREARIKKEMKVEQGEPMGNYSTRIMGSFRKASRRGVSTTSGAAKVTLIRLGTILILVLCSIAYMTWGRVALYGFMFFIPFYIYLKFKRR